MSIKIMSAAWALEIGATDKIVLLALADHANDDGYCWPGNSSLQRKCGLSERAVRLALGTLETAGHITRHFIKGKSTSYHIHPGTTCPRQDMPPAPRAATPAPRAPKSSVTVIHDKANALSKTREVLPDWIPAEAWAGYDEMRRKMRKGMTIRARQLAINKLAALMAEGHDPGAVLDQSTMNNWQGLFPIKETRNGNGHMANGRTQHRASASLDWIERNLGGGGGAFEADEGSQGMHRGTCLALPGSA